MLKIILFLVFIFSIFLINRAVPALAQTDSDVVLLNEIATESAISTPSAETETTVEEDLTRPEEDKARREFLALFLKRPINEPDFTNFIGFSVQYAVRTGVPANTIILVLLVPLLATIAVAVRQIIGIPTLEMLVPIALSITLVATGLFAGAILLTTILVGSIVARLILKRIRIMQLPKMALSMLIVSLCVFASLVIAASLNLFQVDRVSFLPVLLLILLSDKIVGLQLARGSKPAIVITVFTLLLGGIGYLILSLPEIRNTILLYPELILLLIPINILLGRYFGLRLTEYRRFSTFRKYVDQ